MGPCGTGPAPVPGSMP